MILLLVLLVIVVGYVAAGIAIKTAAKFMM